MGKTRKNRRKSYNRKNSEPQKIIQEAKGKSEESKKKFNLEDFRNIMTVLIAFFALIVSVMSLNRSNATLTPKFSLEVMENENNCESLNRTFKLYNVGGQIVNPKITPILQLELVCMVCDEYGEDDREGIVLIGFSDYFTEDFFYNNVESAFIISENKADKLYDLLDRVENNLNKENERINFYSIKYYFEVSYYDYKGKKKNEILCPTSNFAMLYYQDDTVGRYFNNIELKYVKQIKEEDIILPLDFDENFVVTTTEEFDDEEMALNQEMKEKRESHDILSDFIINYLEYNSLELESYDDVIRELTTKKIEELIVDEDGLAVGVIECYDNENKLNLIVFLVLIAIIFLILIVYLKKRKQRKKK